MAVNFPVYQPPDISGSFAQGQQDATRAAEAPLTLANMLDEQKMSKLTLANAEKQSKDQAQVKSILQGVDYSSTDGLADAASKLSRAGYGTESMNLLRFGQQYASGEHQQRLDKLEETSKQQGRIATELDIATAQLDAMKAAGADPKALDVQAAQIVDKVLPQLKQDHPDLAPQIDQWAKNPGLRTYAGLKKFEEISNQSTAMLNKQIEAARLGLEQQRLTATTELGKERLDIERGKANRGHLQTKTVDVPKRDKDGKAVLDDGGNPVTEKRLATFNPDTGELDVTDYGASGKGGGGAMNMRLANRVLGAANESESALTTTSKMGSAVGIWGHVKPTDTVSNFFTSEQVKRYNSTMAGLAVEVATAQNQGMIPNDPQIAEVREALTIGTSDDIQTARYKLALGARYVRKGLETSMTMMNPEQRKLADKVMGNLSVFPDPDEVDNSPPDRDFFSETRGKGPGVRTPAPAAPGQPPGAPAQGPAPPHAPASGTAPRAPAAAGSGQTRGIPTEKLPQTNAQGWSLHTDAKGRRAYVGPPGPDGKPQVQVVP